MKNLPSLLLLAVLVAPQAKAWDASFAADYTQSFVPSDPYMGFQLGLGHSLSSAWQFQVEQGMGKNLVVDSSQEEWEAGDTFVGLSFSPQAALAWNIGIGSSLPVSASSQHNEMMARPELSISVSGSPIRRINLSGSSFFRYQLNRYESAAATNGEGCEGLMHYSYGLGQGGSARLSRRFSLGYAAHYYEVKYHDVVYEGTGSPLIDRRPDQGYSLSAFLSAALWAQASAALGFQQGSLLQQASWSDYLLFDEEVASWSLSFSQTF